MESMRFFPNWNRDIGTQVTGMIDLIHFVREGCPAEVWCELGSFIGESALLIASFPFVKKIHCIDNFRDRERHKKMLARMSHLNHKVEIHDCDTQSFYETMPEGHFDVVYVDADHRYEMAKKDIEFALRAVKEGGFVCGHDYHFAHKGVVRAVDEFLSENAGLLGNLNKFCDASFAIQKRRNN